MFERTLHHERITRTLTTMKESLEHIEINRYKKKVSSVKSSLDSRWEESLSSKVRRSRSVANNLLTHMHYDGKSKVRRASLLVEKDGVGVTDDEMNDDDEMFVNYKEMIQNENREHERIVREMRVEYSNRLEYHKKVLEEIKQSQTEKTSDDITFSEMERRFNAFQKRLLEAYVVFVVLVYGVA